MISQLFRARPFDLFTHHKCASSWLHTYLETFGRLNDLRYRMTHCSDRLPDFPKRNADLRLSSNANYDFVRSAKLQGLHIIRSPLSILASAFHSHLKTHTTQLWPELARQRSLLQTTDRDHGYLLTIAFLERSTFGANTVGPFQALRDWDFDDPRFPTLRMEDVVLDVSATIGAALTRHFGPDVQLPPAEDFAFHSFSGAREVGEINDASHYRCGHSLQWQRDLPAAAIAYVTAHFTEILERFYPDHLASSGLAFEDRASPTPIRTARAPRRS